MSHRNTSLPKLCREELSPIVFVVPPAAERLNADLLLVGHGSAAGDSGRYRSHAYAIIRQSPCPVVSV
jgi:nucleotide-binding universal stress UspA family protein